VPQSDVPGESTSLTQPVPVKPPPFVRQQLTEAELIDFTPALREQALAHVSNFRLGGRFTPSSRVDDPDGTQGTMGLPSPVGGANWQGGAYDPDTGIVYATSREMAWNFSLEPGGDNSSVAWIAGPNPNTIDGLPLIRPPWGRITAIDLNSGEELWWIPNADTPAAVENHPALQGVDLPRTGSSNLAGILLTKTLLISGEGSGGKPLLRAHDKASGDIVAEVNLPASQTGMPMTYMLDGKQYLVVTVSGGGKSEIVALSLPD